MELKLKRCTIRDYRPSDAQSLAKHANNRRVWLGLRDAFPHPYTIEDANEFLRGSVAGLPRKNFCIEIGGAAVGGIGLRPGEDVHRHTAEFGYWLAEEFWGQGIMSEIVPAFVDYCFKEFSPNRISPCRIRTIPLPRAFWRKPASFLKDACERAWSKTEKFSIRFCSPRQSNFASCITW